MELDATHIDINWAFKGIKGLLKPHEVMYWITEWFDWIKQIILSTEIFAFSYNIKRT